MLPYRLFSIWTDADHDRHASRSVVLASQARLVLAGRFRCGHCRGRAVVKEKLGALVTDEDVANFPINLACWSLSSARRGLAEKSCLRPQPISASLRKSPAVFLYLQGHGASDGERTLGVEPKRSVGRNLVRTVSSMRATLSRRRCSRRSSGAIFVVIFRASWRRLGKRPIYSPPFPGDPWTRGAPPSAEASPVGQKRTDICAADPWRQDVGPDRLDQGALKAFFAFGLPASR